jgi:hypothetical protein
MTEARVLARCEVRQSIISGRTYFHWHCGKSTIGAHICASGGDFVRYEFVRYEKESIRHYTGGFQAAERVPGRAGRPDQR